jgi:hypothetical protein
VNPKKIRRTVADLSRNDSVMSGLHRTTSIPGNGIQRATTSHKLLHEKLASTHHLLTNEESQSNHVSVPLSVISELEDTLTPFVSDTSSPMATQDLVLTSSSRLLQSSEVSPVSPFVFEYVM